MVMRWDESVTSNPSSGVVPTTVTLLNTYGSDVPVNLYSTGPHTEFAGLPTLVEEYAVTETVYSDPTKNFSVSKPPTEVL